MDTKIEPKDRISWGISIAGIIIGAIIGILGLVKAYKTNEVNNKLINDRNYAQQQTQIAQQNNYYVGSPELLKKYVDTINASTAPMDKLEIK